MGEESLGATKQMETGQKKQGRHSTMDKMKEALHFNKKWRGEQQSKIWKRKKKIAQVHAVQNWWWEQNNQKRARVSFSVRDP
jgi:hypothetical protein